MINFKLVLKGAAMGCADLVPGVSGGTVALITGIYEELIDSIRSVDGDVLKLLLKRRFKEVWHRVNGYFLIHVFGGVLLSAFTLSGFFSYLLANHPIPLWSFFFGLIIISALYVKPKNIQLNEVVFVVLGVLAAYFVTTISPAATPETLWFIFVSGAVAICAMILPGISGSFILILLVKYEFILLALKGFDLTVLAIFGMGCIIGLVTFSKIIYWLLQHYRPITMASLAGFMLGSLNKIWPWKTITDEFSYVNLGPSQYTEHTGEPNQLMLAIGCCIAGGGLVFVLERLGGRVS